MPFILILMSSDKIWFRNWSLNSINLRISIKDSEDDPIAPRSPSERLINGLRESHGRMPLLTFINGIRNELVAIDV